MSERAAFDGVFVDEDILGVAHELARLRPGEVYYVGHPDVPEIPPGTLYKFSAAALIDDHWSEIVDSIGKQPGPAVWSLTRPNGLRRIDADL
ncbi:hypothetical protein [Candidatus Poriferisodalis sp.]|uniref:hypothetical protein n=1 Tax=Candidatus Poriferisodalis sp. TaxID=3101277 RepID=UPI003B0210CE